MNDYFDILNLESKAAEFASLAIKFDNEKNYEAALIYYKETIELCMQISALSLNNFDLKKNLNEYITRAEIILDLIKKEKFDKLNKNRIINQDEVNLKTAQFILNEALLNDEKQNIETAINLYTEAVDLCIKVKKTINDKNINEKLTKLANDALNRAEKLKNINFSFENNINKEIVPLEKSLNELKINNDIVEEKKFNLNEHNLIVIGESNYTKNELFVIKKTSLINNRNFVPFLSIDLKERFAFSIPYTDKDGMLNLSSKQKQYFLNFVRLNELVKNPSIIKNIDCFSIKQTIITDCSFIASLTVSALYEKRFKKKLVTSIIYPQNKDRQPCYNPCGKYMIKLHLNGIFRKIIIDDYLPVDKYKGLLCSYSSNEDEFWVSLLEKAYLKVMGGYDFPGSNSSIDLNALTGWIPDRIKVENTVEAEKSLKNLSKKLNLGNVLITVATMDLKKEDSERCGLVPNHAYALLDIKFVENKTLLLLKNPWQNQRWKGNYSECDQINWTPSLKKALNFDPKEAKAFDNGVFWIDLKSFAHFFEMIFLNWNPSIFKYTYCLHSFWSANKGPIFDSYSFGENPQYNLSVNQNNKIIWALLTRHITDKDDFANNKIYLSIVVYKGGEKIYVQNEPYIDGVRVNSPHYLCKIPVPNDCSEFTLIISQYEKTTTIYYSLRIYSFYPFTIRNIIEKFNFEKEVKGEWNDLNSGGCLMNDSSYSLNPVYRLEVLGPNENENTILFEIKAPKNISVGLDIFAINISNPKIENTLYKMSVDSFRCGLNVLKVTKIHHGTYNVIPCTYHPNIKSLYFLKLKSSCEFKLDKIK